MLTAGTLLTAAGLLVFALGFGTLAFTLLAMIVAGAGFGALLGAPTRYIVTNHVGPEQRAGAVGLLSVFLIVGQIIGGSLGGGVAGSHGSLIEGYRIAYFVFAGIALAATLLTAALAPRHVERASAVR